MVVSTTNPFGSPLVFSMSFIRNSVDDTNVDTYSRSRWLSFALLLVGVFLSPLDFFIVNIALPSIKEELGATQAELQLVISGYMTTYAVFLITGGRLGDIFGRRRMFLGGLASFACASALCGFAPSPGVLVIGRILQGLAAALMVPQGLASINAIFPQEEKSLALGLYGATLGLAAASGQILGGFLIGADILGLGWRVVFLVNLPVAIVVLAFGLLLRGSQSPHPPRLDLAGVGLSALTLALVVVPLVEGRERGWPFWSLLLLMAAPVVGALFLRNERKALRAGGTPILDPRIMALPGVGHGMLAVLFFYAIGVFFLAFSIYLQNALGEGPREAAIIFLPFGAGSFLAPLLSPYLAKRLGAVAAPAGMLIEAIGFFALAFIVWRWRPDEAVDQALRGAALFAIGFGQGAALPSLVRIIIGNVEASWSGLVSGLVNSALQISSALSVAIIGGIFYAVAGPELDPPHVASALVVALICIALCILVAMAATFSLARRSLPVVRPLAAEKAR